MQPLVSTNTIKIKNNPMCQLWLVLSWIITLTSLESPLTFPTKPWLYCLVSMFNVLSFEKCYRNEIINYVSSWNHFFILLIPQSHANTWTVHFFFLMMSNPWCVHTRVCWNIYSLNLRYSQFVTIMNNITMNTHMNFYVYSVLR